MRIASLLLLCAVFAAPSAARAAESFDSCAGFIDSVPATISTQGVWCLRSDLSSALASGALVTIAVNNVTIDCNGYKIGGLAAGPDTLTRGIVATGRSNATVRNCTLRGFRFGVALADSPAARVHDNLVEASTLTGIWVEGDGSAVRANTVVDTVGDTLDDPITGIFARGSVDVIDNTVSGVQGQAVIGIAASFNGDGVIGGNRVRGLAGNASAPGIRATNNGYVVIRDNVVIGPGSTAITCGSNRGTARNNTTAGFEFATVGCTTSGNFFNPN